MLLTNMIRTCIGVMHIIDMYASRDLNQVSLSLLRITPNINCFGGALRTVDCLGGTSGKALSLVSLQFSTDNRDTSLEECEDGFQCGHQVGWVRVEHGVATCTLVLVYVSIKLSESL
jgi:hypothetical protein